MDIVKQIYPAVALTVVLTVLLGIIYPLAVTGLAQVMFPRQAVGSLIEKNGKVVGSSLIGQTFSGRGYFHSRPSGAGNGYDAGASSGTNLGPTSRKLFEMNVRTAAKAFREERPDTAIPVDMVTGSSSGLDPHITPAAAEFQVPRIASERGLPEAIVLDNGPEFRGRALAAWSEERGVRLEFIQPGKPVQNAYAESFNGRLRDECLNANWFTSLRDARRKIESWRQDYNQQRPHSSLNYLPPLEFARTLVEMRA